MFLCKLHCKAKLPVLEKNMFDVSINTSHTICRGFAHAEMSRGFTRTCLMWDALRLDFTLHHTEKQTVPIKDNQR